MIEPGKYRATTAIAIELCRRTGYYSQPAVNSYTSYRAGEEFEIPATINEFFYRVMQDPFREEPPGTYERIDRPRSDEHGENVERSGSAARV